MTTDPVIKLMQEAGIPITREEYLYIGYFGQPCVRSSWCEDARSSGLATAPPYLIETLQRRATGVPVASERRGDPATRPGLSQLARRR
jgi:hypothetical protein